MTPCINSNFKTTQFVQNLKRHFHDLKPVPGTCRESKRAFVFKDLHMCDYVLVRHDEIKGTFQMHCGGPYSVISRSDKTFTVLINDKNFTLSIDSLKPTYHLDFCEKSKPHTKIDVHNTASLQQMSSYQAENLRERQ